ncbi:hypothetical protein AGLY_007322 [Aphis glycines]|uniref:Uncharacterized protein n=1 Tax=Aphis glycines TaxID=307491 RepID=A0A6G0TPB4_APHGL|nr:hypothetical protein AGLY_007322 [Aphis glycines]
MQNKKVFGHSSHNLHNINIRYLYIPNYLENGLGGLPSLPFPFWNHPWVNYQFQFVCSYIIPFKMDAMNLADDVIQYKLFYLIAENVLKTQELYYQIIIKGLYCCRPSWLRAICHCTEVVTNNKTNYELIDCHIIRGPYLAGDPRHVPHVLIRSFIIKKKKCGSYLNKELQVSGRDPKACATATIGSYSLYRRLRQRHRFIYGIWAGGLQRNRLVDVSYSRIKRIPCRSRPQARTATTAAADADNI